MKKPYTAGSSFALVNLELAQPNTGTAHNIAMKVAVKSHRLPILERPSAVSRTNGGRQMMRYLSMNMGFTKMEKVKAATIGTSSQVTR